MSERIITDELFDGYVRSLIEDEKSPATVEKYTRDLRGFLYYVNGRSVDKTLVLEYKSLLGKKRALSSANSMLAAVNSFLRFAGWHVCCVKQYKIQKSAFCTEEKELSKGEFLALVKTAEKRKNRRLALLLQTICGTGIRVSEVRFITVEAVKNGEAIVTCKGKTRRVFIVSSLRKRLLAYAVKHRIRSGMIFVTSRGNALNRSNIWTEMKSLCVEAGVSPGKVFPHNLRHLFARTFY
ncbi:MAG: tyrosine-type recombinase/integrase, partial [Clostridia bacterium]|nr:tyrosine-type recombinase/integrase [Clostridia bacterium]